MAAARHNLVLLLAAIAAGCGDPPPVPDPSTGRIPAASITGPGVVKGKVILDGPAPMLPPIKNAPCCDGAPATLPDETVVVNPDKTLQNVMVYLQGGPLADGKDLPRALLDQKFCRYTPRVVGVVVGQTLRIRSSDPIVHNVHYKTAEGNTNLWMRLAGEASDVSFKTAEFIQTGCDVHPWMKADIAVMDTPLFAVTRESGTFEIPNVPAGEYKLTIWHRLYGKQEKPITIKDSTPLEVDFTYAPPR